MSMLGKEHGLANIGNRAESSYLRCTDCKSLLLLELGDFKSLSNYINGFCKLQKLGIRLKKCTRATQSCKP